MLSIDECKRILNKKEQKYSTEQVKETREALYLLASLTLEIKKNNNEKSEGKECNNIQ